MMNTINNYYLSLIKSALAAGLSMIVLLTSLPLHAEDNNNVNITENKAKVELEYSGKQIIIQRIQDQNNKLTNSFAKTSRPCPPFCISPMTLAEGIETIGELELIKFIENDVQSGKGLLIDARMPEWYEKATIPGSINIPFTVISTEDNNEHTLRILKLLGATEKKQKGKKDPKAPLELDFTQVKSLALFCNGSWCGQSGQAIKRLLKLGYPANKLFWYRGGMQAWLILGLSIVTP